MNKLSIVSNTITDFNYNNKSYSYFKHIIDDVISSYVAIGGTSKTSILNLITEVIYSKLNVVGQINCELYEQIYSYVEENTILKQSPQLNVLSITYLENNIIKLTYLDGSLFVTDGLESAIKEYKESGSKDNMLQFITAIIYDSLIDQNDSVDSTPLCLEIYNFVRRQIKL